jgi:hypothetical protein
MLCDKYKEALIQAAASDAGLPKPVGEHVDACPHCREMLASSQVLFATVDAGLHRAANAGVRSSFLSNVKANLASETVATQHAVPGWVFVCATAALVLVAAFFTLPRGARDEARTEAITVSSRVPADAGRVGLSLAREHKTRYPLRAPKAREQRGVSDTASHEPEVLIQPGEEEFLERFYLAVRNPVGDAKTAVADEHEITPKPLVIEQIEVKDLIIETLDEESGLTQTGTE